jgi:hypothetical protein
MLIRGFFDQTDCMGLIFFIMYWLQPSLPMSGQKGSRILNMLSTCFFSLAVI